MNFGVSFVLFVLLVHIPLSVRTAQLSPYIHIDQFGYTTLAEKVAVLNKPQTGYNDSLSYAPGYEIILDS